MRATITIPVSAIGVSDRRNQEHQEALSGQGSSRQDNRPPSHLQLDTCRLSCLFSEQCHRSLDNCGRIHPKPTGLLLLFRILLLLVHLFEHMSPHVISSSPCGTPKETLGRAQAHLAGATHVGLLPLRQRLGRHQRRSDAGVELSSGFRVSGHWVRGV